MSAPSLFIGETKHGCRVGLLNLQNKNEVVVNSLRRHQEMIPRRNLLVSSVEDLATKDKHKIPYILELIKDDIRALKIPFRPEDRNKDILMTIEVMNKTDKPMDVTTNHMRFTIDARESDWKPPREDWVMRLAPHQGIRIHADIEEGRCYDNALFRIAEVVPIRLSDQHFWIWYRLEDSITIKEVILQTATIIMEAFQQIRTYLSREETKATLDRDSGDVDMSKHDMSIAYLIQRRAMALGHTVAVIPDPDPPNKITLRVVTNKKSLPVHEMLHSVCTVLQQEFVAFKSTIGQIKPTTKPHEAIFKKKHELIGLARQRRRNVSQLLSSRKTKAKGDGKK